MHICSLMSVVRSGSVIVRIQGDPAVNGLANSNCYLLIRDYNNLSHCLLDMCLPRRRRVNG